MLQFIRSFPFIEFEKKPVVYEYRLVNGNPVSAADVDLIKTAKKNLSNHNINLNKIRFVIGSEFYYDINTNTINPQYAELISSKETIGLNKPERIFKIQMSDYGLYGVDVYDMLKAALKYEKRGIVIKATEDFNQGIEMVSLDDEIQNYIEFTESLNNM